MASFKVSENFSATFNLSSSSSKFRDQTRNLSLHLRGNSTYPVLISKLQSNDEAKGRSWRTFVHRNRINGASQNYITDQYSESIFSIISADCDYDSETKMSANVSATILDKLKAVRLWLLASENQNFSKLKLCHRSYQLSATNLTHYLALQVLNVEQLNESLSSIGLLYLKSASPCILESINNGIQMLQNLVDYKDINNYVPSIECDYMISAMRKRVSLNAAELFGPSDRKKEVSIMATVGREAMANDALITDLLRAGANVLRINCAHDGPNVWREIIRMAKSSSQMLEKPCRVLMDLAGAKPRTGPPMSETDELMVSSVQILMCSNGRIPGDLSPDGIICVDEKLIDGLKMGDVVHFSDGRGKKNSFKVVKKFLHVDGSVFTVESTRTTTIRVGTKLYQQKGSKKISVGQVFKLLKADKFMVLKVGDLLTVSRLCCSSTNSTTAKLITCSSDHLYDAVKPDEPIAFDDGRIRGKIQEKNADEIIVLITHASPVGSKLGTDKSINIPKSEVQLKGLTKKDLADLDFITTHADMVGLSFVRNVNDIESIQDELEKRKQSQLGIILKVETKEAFEKLPDLLFHAMQYPNPLGVMIGRGDLMVECGWENMAELQEEIITVCAAAHVPVIWATGVLESFVKSGLPSRAEITDVASGMRASCIMLNKGDHIADAVLALDSTLHKEEKITLANPLLPPLNGEI
ncbi:plastidial pyruvate kinase 4, chloroplastic-like [Typha latifolia]|uniref:plastidial pyruvate kinase 4, chloroplastic-like n=1 Tax=Typha latifolia TaxID=4733 RepID=UPI003C2ED1A0